MATVTLRDVTTEDLDTLFQQQLDDESNHMAGFTSEDPSDRDAFDNRWERIFADEGLVRKVIVVDSEIVGNISCHSWYGQPEVSYWVDRPHWGKGYASAALGQLLEIATERPLFAVAAADNLGSIRILERAGFMETERRHSFANARGEEIEEIQFVLTS